MHALVNALTHMLALISISAFSCSGSGPVKSMPTRFRARNRLLSAYTAHRPPRLLYNHEAPFDATTHPRENDSKMKSVLTGGVAGADRDCGDVRQVNLPFGFRRNVATRLTG